MKSRFFFILSLFLAPAVCLLTTLSASEEEENSEYIFQILYMKGPDRNGVKDVGTQVQFLATSEETVLLHAPHRSLTRPVLYEGPSRIVFFEESVDAEGEVTRTPIASTELGAPGMKVIIMSRNSSGRLVSSALDVSMSGFQPNNVRVINLSKQLIKMKLEDSLVTLKSMKTHDFPATVGKRNAFYRLSLAALNGEEPYLVANERMAMRRDGRELIIVHHDPAKPLKLTYSPYTLASEADVQNYSDNGEYMEKERDFGIYGNRFKSNPDQIGLSE